jgi:valyl-tRNA synthetase
VREADAAYSGFQLAEAARILHGAIWSELCDWYLEMAKVRLAVDAPPATRAATWQVLAWVLDRFLRMLHPVMPHITEEIWGRLPHRPDDGDLLITAAWPGGDPGDWGVDVDQAAAVAAILELVSQMRTARTDASIAPATWLDAELRFDDERLVRAFEAIADAVARLARLRPRLTEGSVMVSSAEALVVVAPGAEARLSVGREDRERDEARLRKELEETERLLASTRAKLDDASFVERAPGHIVDGVRDRAAELEALAARLREHLRS